MGEPFESIRLAYVSLLAPGADYRTVSDLFRTARRRNAEAGIGGFLVFDGSRFCSLLHGPAGMVSALRRVIEADGRHVGFKVCFETRSAQAGAVFQMPPWRSGYADPALVDRIEQLEPVDAASVEREIDVLARSADLDNWAVATG